MNNSEKNTYCPKLWEEFFIIENGDVFPCCERPQKVGNLYEEKLDKIYNSDSFKKLREDSLNNKLSCYKNCRILNKGKIKFQKKPIEANYQEEPRKLRLLFGEKCNLNCIMCHQNSKDQKVLSFETVKNNIDLTPFKKIDSQGGEPLYIKEANQFFDYAISQGKKVSLLTNCMLMNESWAKKIALHSGFIHISLNASTKEMHEKINCGSNWERVMKNIQLIKKYKEQYKTDLRIIGHMTILIRNLDQIPEFIEKHQEFGFESINFGFTRSANLYLKINPVKRNALRKRVLEAIEKSSNKEKIETFRLKLIGLA